MKLQHGNEITLIKLIFHSLNNNKSVSVRNNHICFVLMDIIKYVLVERIQIPLVGIFSFVKKTFSIYYE